MNLTDYIEKDLQRQIHLIETLYYKQTASFQELAQILHASPITIKSDYQKILTYTTKPTILKLQHSNLSLYLADKKHFHILKQQLYRQSSFLQVCCLYCLQTANYLEVVEQSFISVSQAYRIKHKIKKYLTQTQMTPSPLSQVFNQEYNQRSFILNVYSLIGPPDDEQTTNYLQQVEQILQFACQNLQIQLFDSDYQRLTNFLTVQLLRTKNHPIYYKEEVPLNIIHQPLIRTIVQYCQQAFPTLHFSKDEQLFLAFYLTTCHLTIHSADLSIFSFEDLLFQLDIPLIENEIATILDIPLSLIQNNKLLQTNLQHFIAKSLFSPMPLYDEFNFFQLAPSDNFVQNKQKKLAQMRHLYPKCHFSKQAFNQFFHFYQLFNQQERPTYQLSIISSDQFADDLYRKQLGAWINQENIQINPKPLHDFKQVYIQADTIPLIICERQKLPSQTNNLLIFPISLISYKADIKKVLAYLYTHS